MGLIDGATATLHDLAGRVASTDIPVLITGETGTGKEVLARLIHARSRRATAEFVPFNCATVPRDLLDMQLFGHRQGAFTGAVAAFGGVILAATGGTLFLDEVGDVSLEVQPKLLRFLESGDVHAIGAARAVRADARVIAATNADLEALVAGRRLREDLYYRLNVMRLHVAPLRERPSEIPALAQHHLQTWAGEYGKGTLWLSREALEVLVSRRWPGNVRQLANEMRTLAALAAPNAVLMPKDLRVQQEPRFAPAPAASDPAELVLRLDQPMFAAIRRLEREMIDYALRISGGRTERAAAMLGLSRKGLYLKRQRFAVDEEPTPTLRARAG